MHPNLAFQDANAARNIAFARERGFGVLAVSVDGAPLMSHIPFTLNDGGTAADLHLVRSNPITRLAGVVPARIAVMGPDSYISPDWYGVQDQVPTWNYVAVHLTGTLTRLPQTDMHAMLDRQSAAYEARLHPKAPWTTAKMTPEILESMMRQIVPFRFDVTAIEGTWKLGQNKPEEVRLRAAAAIGLAAFGHERKELVRMMRALDHR